MTKGKGTRLNIPDANPNGNKEREAVFTNSIGLSFTVHGLSPLELPRLRENIVYPEKPTYSIQTASGDTEVFDHDETTLVTEEDKKAWSEYEQAFSEAEEELTNRMLNCVLIDGVEISEDIDLTRWEKRQKLKGLDVSEDLEEKLLAYKKSEVIRSADDIKELMRLVLKLTGVNQEVIDLTKQSFPDKVES